MIEQDRSAYRRGGPRAMGFAKLSLEENREISSRGGKRAKALGRAYKWTSETAKIAGRKGGAISRRGKKGGESR